MEPYGAGEFLQGFLEESGELLSAVRQNLLRLEEIQPAADRGQSEAEAIEQVERLNELFRSFHTMKGLCGMVGLHDAALLSHSMESALRAVQDGSVGLTHEVIDRFIAGAQALGQMVASLRSPGQPSISAAESVESFEQILHPRDSQPPPVAQAEEAQAEEAPAQPGPPLAPNTTEGQITALLPELAGYPDLLKGLGELEYKKIQTAARERQSFALAAFTSSAERAARGENIDWVRQRIQEVAALIKAVPSISGGNIRFYFLLASRQPLTAGLPFVDEIIPLAAQVRAPIEPIPEPYPASTPQPAGGVRPARSAHSPDAPGAPSAVVRVELARLDELMRYTSELTLLRSRFGEVLGQMDGSSKQARRELENTYQQLGRKLRGLRQAILRTRMVPLAETFNHMPLVVRDLARTSHKDVRLHMEGETTEVDKLLVERLLDPLIHLVRNAIIHGVEAPEERVQGGKSPQGNLMLRAIPTGDHILIEISDDGRGIDLQGVANRAVEQGWLAPGQAIGPEEALEWITRPGFSTQATADLAAGRGIGLDVVYRMVRSFGGQLTMETVPGKGTTFRLRLPLTLVIVDVVLVRSGGDRYAVRRDSIERIIEIQPGQIVSMEGGELLPRPDGFYLLYRLEKLFGSRPAVLASQAASKAAPQAAPQAAPADSSAFPDSYGLIIATDTLGQEANHVAQQPILIVDRVQGMQEVVVQPVTDPLVARPGIGGATEMGDGSVVLILDIPSLLRLGRTGERISP